MAKAWSFLVQVEVGVESEAGAEAGRVCRVQEGHIREPKQEHAQDSSRYYCC